MKKYHIITTLLCLIAISLLPIRSVPGTINKYEVAITPAFSNQGYKTASMPEDFYQVQVTKERKQKFINIMLSVIEEVNRFVPEEERVPTSIILAQSALETGWGQSRFLKEGNALFGEWTFKGKGIKPKNAAEDSKHKVKSFETLHSSMESYINNINKSRYYKSFRNMRKEGASGLDLAESLNHYSEEGNDYVNKVKTMIIYNNLEVYDNIRHPYVGKIKSWFEKLSDRI